MLLICVNKILMLMTWQKPLISPNLVIPCVRRSATLWSSTGQQEPGRIKPSRVTLGLHQSKSEQNLAFFFFFLQKQNRNVSALQHVHDTDLFFLTTMKWTGLEPVPNLAELLPSLLCWFVWQHWQPKRRFTLTATLHIYTRPGKWFQLPPVLLCDHSQSEGTVIF